MIPALLAAAALAAPVRAASARLAVTPEEVRTTPTRDLARALVARLRRECDEADPSGAGEPPAAGGRLVMTVPAKVFASIARFGFLNQHQTRTTGGFDRLEERFEAEQGLAMARLPYDLKGRELLPKYAFLDAPDRGLGRFLLPKRYGEVAVVFKTEVAERATWTYADTLDFSRRAGRFDRGGAANPVLPHTFAYRRRAGERLRCVNYCEAQIWGELRLDDVDYVMVPNGAPVPAGAAGLAVYRYSVPASTAAAGAPARTLVYRRGARVRPPAGAQSLPDAAEFRAMPELAGLRESFEEARLTDEKAAVRLSSATAPEERLRLAGLLAARAKSETVVAALKEAARGPDAAARAVALLGLSELPWAEFAPILLGAAKDDDWRVQAAFAALAAEHLGRPETAAAAAELEAAARERARDPRDDRSGDVLEWLSRADRPRLCAPPAR